MRATNQVRAGRWVLPLLLAGAGCADFEGADADAPEVSVQESALTSSPSAFNPDKVLFVRDVSVVDNPTRTVDPCKSTSEADANRHWTFGYLLKQMAAKSGMTANDFAASWLYRWQITSLVWATPAPGAIPFNPSTTLNEVIDPEITSFPGPNGEESVPAVIMYRWRKASCLQAAGRDIADPAADTICPPDRVNATPLAMNKAPFRLLAIVNRPDLRKVRYFGEGNAGELRFVFQILNPMIRDEDGSGACAGLGTPGGDAVGENQLVILEYAAHKADPKAYGRQWEALNTLALDSSTYREKLQAITDGIVNSGAAPSNVNQSALIRIRTNTTNDNAVWFLREFMIATNRGLEPVEVKQTPLNELNDHLNPNPSQNPVLYNWANANQTAILNQTHLLPSMYQGQRLRGLKGVNLQHNTWWQMLGVSNNEVRHKLSLNTCSGCHGLETGAGNANNTGNQFAMVLPRHYRERSAISSFITGVGKDGQPYQVTDPGNNNVKRTFSEFKVRQTELWNLIYR